MNIDDSSEENAQNSTESAILENADTNTLDESYGVYMADSNEYDYMPDYDDSLVEVITELGGIPEPESGGD